MGYYNSYGLWAIIGIDLVFCVIKIQIFVILATIPLDVRLKTQVLGNGRVLLLAYDSFDREVMKIILH